MMAITHAVITLSYWLEDNFPHRSVTHSLLATGFLSVIAQRQPLADHEVAGFT